MDAPALVIATGNAGKIREFSALLADLGFSLKTLADFPGCPEVAEDADTFEANAAKKARAVAAYTGLAALADDSGLEVNALGGRPGVHSARYAGEGATDAQRMSYLLTQLKDIAWEKRTARFRCVIAIAGPDGPVEICSGECPGIITSAPAGKHGFGYDPVFYLPEMGKTMAELTPAQKNLVSHRAQAAGKARRVLERRCAP